MIQDQNDQQYPANIDIQGLSFGASGQISSVNFGKPTGIMHGQKVARNRNGFSLV